MTSLTIFCSSKLTVNNTFYEPCKNLITLLNNDFKYVYGGGSDGLMGCINRICIACDTRCIRCYRIGVASDTRCVCCNRICIAGDTRCVRCY